jgi:hypothetical protein
VSFQLLAMLGHDEQPVFSGGFYVVDGVGAPLVSMRREVVGRTADGYPEGLIVAGSDGLGRPLQAEGRTVSRAAIPGFAGYLTWASVVSWDIAGTQACGEDHDSWPHAMVRRRLQTRA